MSNQHHRQAEPSTLSLLIRAAWQRAPLCLLGFWMLLDVGVRSLIAGLAVPPGTQDSAFQVQLRASAAVYDVTVQADGKLVVLGDFSDFNGVSVSGLARLNPNGSVDPSFQPTAGALLGADTIAQQPDGKLVVSGQFRSPDGTAFTSVGRLNADGTPDASFANPILDDEADRIVLQPDGKVLIEGYFTTANGLPRNNVARLNADGSLDTSFDLGADMLFSAGPLAVQADGKILFSSTFLDVGGIAYPALVRLNADGSIDPAYQSGLSKNASLGSLVLQADGKAVVQGDLGNAGSQSVERLNLDGSVDASFNAGLFNGVTNGVTALPGGGVAVTGYFTQVQGLPRPGIVRLLANGSVDPAFVPPAGSLVAEQYAVPGAVAAQADGKLILTGRFVFVGGQPSPSVARFNLDGSLDASFHPGTGAGMGTPSGGVEALAVQPDGKVLIGGEFSSVNGVPCIGYARLNADGSVDTSFQTSTGTGTPGVFQLKPLPGVVDAFSIQPDGKIIVAGFFDHLGGRDSVNSGRLNPDGSVDTGFRPPLTLGGLESQYGLIEATALQPDGKVLVAGSFLTPKPNLARFNADGSLDKGFNPQLSYGAGVNAVVVQPDGHILIGGYFGYNASTGQGSGIARLNADGSLDVSFQVGMGVNGEVSDLVLQADGRIVIGGGFTTFNGVPRGGVARLNADGSLDTSFYPGAGINGGSVEKLALQPDGRLLVRGTFTAFGGAPLAGLARLNTNGSLDYGFIPTLDLGTSNYAFALQSDGKILTGISNGQVVRLEGGEGHPPFFAGEEPVSSDFYYLVFPGGNLFGYYSDDFFPYLYHADLGFEYFFDAGDATHGAYLYDFASSTFFYTSPSFPFPYLYDFGLNSVLYYYPDPARGGHYTTNPRYFYDFATGEIITK